MVFYLCFCFSSSIGGTPKSIPKMVTSAGVKGIFLGYLLSLDHPLCVLGGGGQGAESALMSLLSEVSAACQHPGGEVGTGLAWAALLYTRQLRPPSGCERRGRWAFFPSPLGRLNRVFLFVFVVFVWLCLG